MRRAGGQENKFTLESIHHGDGDSDMPSLPKYRIGTILGYDIRRDSTTFRSGAGSNGTFSSMTRQAKVYQLKAAKLLYKVDYCGALSGGTVRCGAGRRLPG